MNPAFKGYLRLCRPPNLPTAAADVLAGLAIAGFFDWPVEGYAPIFLVFASIALYAGGVVLNDVFDYELDKVERPERPIPSGVVSLSNAKILGFSLLASGVLLASFVNRYSLVVALTLVFAILAYDRYSKNKAFMGPLNMGLCRSLNLLLGMTVYTSLEGIWYLGIPMLFIFAVTTISRGEVHGNNRKNILFAGVLYVLVVFYVFALNMTTLNLTYVLFVLIFCLMVFVPLIKAYRNNQPSTIKKAVKAGVLSIISLDAAMAVANSSWVIGILIVLLFPLALVLAKKFAVT